MRKVGPCCHCGVRSTPLWRNGPPDKPVLCNACGSRWRTKGTLTNYTPLHARETFDADEVRSSKIKILPFKNKEPMLENAEQGSNPLELEHEMQYCDQNFRKFVKGDVNNRSSSGSAVSNSECYSIAGTINANDMAGSLQSIVWESLVPSKKRTFFTRPKASPVEKLTKDLFSILHEQQSSNLSGLSEEDLIYENETPFGSTEIGYGSLLIRHPNYVYVEEESEASSLPLDKSDITNGSHLGLTSSPVNLEIKGSNNATDKLKNSSARSAEESVRRDKTSVKLKLLLDRDSSLGSIDLNDLINFESFMKYLTYEEQQTLMKYLPSTDTVRLPQSLRTMFRSSQFIETYSFFQQLLQEGIFDLTFSGVDVGDCRRLKRLVLLDLERYKWVENYRKLKVRVGKGKEMGPNVLRIYNLTSAKRAHDYLDQDSSDTGDGPMRSPKRVCKLEVSNSQLSSSPQLKSTDTASKLSVGKGGVAEVEGGGFFTRMSLVPSMSDMCSMLMASSQFTDDSADQDLLLNVPPCNASYPEAELLCHPWKEKSTPISSPAESIIAAKMKESFSSFRPLILQNRQLTNHMDRKEK